MLLGLIVSMVTTVVGLPVGGSGSPGSGTTITTTSSNQRNGGSSRGGGDGGIR